MKQNSYSSEEACRGTTTTQAFFLGLLVGGAVAVLLAPLSGSDLRRNLQAKAQQGLNAVNESLNDATEAAQALAEDSANFVAQGKERARAEAARLATAVEAGRTAYQQSSPATQNA